MCLTSDQRAAFIGFDIWPIKAAAQTDRCVKHYLKERLRASTGAGAKRGGLKGAQCAQEKKYPLIIYDERVSLRHLNLMTLANVASVLLYISL